MVHASAVFCFEVPLTYHGGPATVRKNRRRLRCPYCKKFFFRPVSQIVAKKRSYCSQKCWYESRPHLPRDSRASYLRNRIKILSKNKENYANRKRIFLYHKEYRKLNLERIRAYDRGRSFERKGREIGWSLKDFKEAWKRQKGRCGLCGKKMRRSGRSMLSVHRDHDHRTGRRRGLIHMGCNLGLGHFKDDPISLEKAARYIRRHRRKN